MEILDGQQRMISLYLYYKGKKLRNDGFSLKKIFALEQRHEHKSFLDLLSSENKFDDYNYMLNRGLKDESSICYNNLPLEAQSVLDFRPLSVIEIKIDGEKSNNRVLYKIFQNLNSGGTKLTPQEVRNGAYASPFYDMLHKFNSENKSWRQVFDSTKKEHKHSDDIQSLLRLCAATYRFELDNNGIACLGNYNSDFQDFLNDFSADAIDFTDQQINDFKNDLESFTACIQTKLRIPGVLLESLFFVCVKMKMNNVINDCIVINDGLITDILNNTDYKDHARSSTTKKSMEARYLDVFNVISRHIK